MRNKQFEALLTGWIIVFAVILVASMILAFLLKFTTISQSIVPWITLCIGVIALFSGGIVAGAKGQAKGWAIGGLIGIGFTLFTFIVQYLGYNALFTTSQSLHHLGYICISCFGGMIGVNITPTNPKTE